MCDVVMYSVTIYTAAPLPTVKTSHSVGAGASARCGPGLNIITTTLPTPHYYSWKRAFEKFEKFYNQEEDPYYDLLLVESAYYC